jgi:hypothetical protein
VPGEAGQLWGVLWLLARVIRLVGGGPEVRLGPRSATTTPGRTLPLIGLKAVCGLGDGGEPATAGMLPRGLGRPPGHEQSRAPQAEKPQRRP